MWVFEASDIAAWQAGLEVGTRDRQVLSARTGGNRIGESR
jgi:hypothetical protein